MMAIVKGFLLCEQYYVCCLLQNIKTLCICEAYNEQLIQD